MTDSSKRTSESRIISSQELDWTEIQLVERDICLLYHQLADYSHIMGDLYYGDVFSLPYWEYLDVDGLEPERQRFVCDGCLVMLYAMAVDVLDGSGTYLTMESERYSAVRNALDRLQPNGHATDRLASALRTLIGLIDRDPSREDGSAELMDEVAESTWVHEHFVRRYFIDRVSDFTSN